TSTGHHSRKTKHGMACRCLTVLYFPFSLSTPVMFEAYRHIVSDTNQSRRSYMLDLLESVRHDYVHGGYT
ncbi:hypothetical protein LNK53_25840, partial [Enterobacter mori]|nr:hypothetical protein [Enterobacter mori]MCC8242649.1 hypothetical protein [Enterobacter mori]